MEIASLDSPRIAILAGPGTGKTSYGLMRRAARLLETDACAPNRILFLTFTRTAGQDLTEKLAALGSPGVDQVRSGTIHGYCLGLIRKEAVLAVTGRSKAAKIALIGLLTPPGPPRSPEKPEESDPCGILAIS